MKSLLIITLGLAIVGCNPCKRIAKMNAKYGMCIDTTKVRIDTIKGDTVRFYFHSTKTELDTVWHTKEGVRIHVVRQKDTLMVQGSCPPCDTIHHYASKVVKVPIREAHTPWWLILALCGSIIVTLIIAIRK